MKHLFKISLLAAGLFAVTQGYAQTHKDSTLGHKIGTTATTVGHATAKTAVTVGHKTAEIAAKGAAAATDRRYEGKVARGGETVYITHHGYYFYVNKTGHRVYLKKSQLMDKPSK